MKVRNIFLSGLFPAFLLLVCISILCNCSCAPKTQDPAEYWAGGIQISFDKDSVVFDARKNKATFKTKHHQGMAISGAYTIIDSDTLFVWNEKIPHDAPFNQQFYFYRDTAYGEWYTLYMV